MTKPILINRAKFSEKDLAERKRLLIETRQPVVILTDKGFVLFPTSGARANAWICAWCHQTPYQDALYTKSEYNMTTPEEEEVPFIMYLTPPGKPDEEMVALEFHFKCVEELGLLRDMIPSPDGNKKKLNLAFTEGGKVIVGDEEIPLNEAFNICEKCFEEKEAVGH